MGFIQGRRLFVKGSLSMLSECVTCTQCRFDIFLREQHLILVLISHFETSCGDQGSLKKRLPHICLQRSRMIFPSNFRQ